ncbi:hypothetical protein ACH4F6_33555 [Streptomyces sp. NPDC017936]|uniref:hypothetical protein n=1 Tax=Streptomyces sp. NPDC017936 TaxID=3365016 RepID=UPI00378BEDF1
MNKHCRRFILMTAGVTGGWGLGSAIAGTDELPALAVCALALLVGGAAAGETGPSARQAAGRTAAGVRPGAAEPAPSRHVHDAGYRHGARNPRAAHDGSAYRV